MPDANRQSKSTLYDDEIEIEIDFRMLPKALSRVGGILGNGSPTVAQSKVITKPEAGN